MNAKYILISCFIGAITLNNCSNSTQVDISSEVNLQSNKNIYSSSEQVQLILSNDTDEELYLNYCGPTLLYTLKVKESENWVNYAGGGCLWIFIPNFRPALEPGESKEITFAFDSLDVGKYRYDLLYKLTSAESDTQKISIEFLVQ